MESKLKPMALQIAGWGLLYGEFFDLYDVSEQLQIPAESARELVVYLRKLTFIETIAETRCCKRGLGKRGTRRIFIKVVMIHPDPCSKRSPTKIEKLRSALIYFTKAMPLPPVSR